MGYVLVQIRFWVQIVNTRKSGTCLISSVSYAISSVSYAIVVCSYAVAAVSYAVALCYTDTLSYEKTYKHTTIQSRN